MSILYDSRLAIWLYTALILTTFMFSQRWADVRDAIASAGKKATSG